MNENTDFVELREILYTQNNKVSTLAEVDYEINLKVSLAIINSSFVGIT